MEASKIKYLTLPIILAALMLAAPVSAGAQGGSITLNVPHVKQEAGQLCWAALVSQLLFQNPAGSRPSQCELVNMINDIKGEGAANCCGNLNTPMCNITANNREMISLMTNFGMKSEMINVPTSPEEVFNYLKSGRVLLLGVKTTANDNHIYMVRGISWENNQAMLIVNDPYYETSVKVPFSQTQPTWLLAIVVG